MLTDTISEVLMAYNNSVYPKAGVALMVAESLSAMKATVFGEPAPSFMLFR